MRLISAPMTLLLALGAPSTFAQPPTEIRVTLFGAPCLLGGPFPTQTLQNIHAISPERIPAKQNLSSAREAIRLLKRTRGLPADLHSYQSRLLTRVQAQFLFLEEALKLKKSGSLEKFLGATTPAMASNQAPFRTRASALKSQKPPKKWNTEDFDDLIEVFERGIETYPEEEFHRAIDRLKIRYFCDFDPEPTPEEASLNPQPQ